MRLSRESPVFYCFLFYVLVWYLQLAERWAHLTGGLRIEAFLAAFLLFVTLSDSFRRTPQQKAGFAPYVVVYFIILTLMTVFSWDTSHSWMMFKDRVIKYAVFALLTCRFVRTPNQLRWFIFIWLVACLKVCLEGVIGGITGTMIWQNQGIPRLHGSGLYGHPNSLSQLALGTLPFVYFLYPVFKKIWWKAFLLALLMSALYCILYTGSRTGYLGVITMLCYLFFLVPRRMKMALFVVVLLMTPLIIKFTPEAYKGRFMSTFVGQEAAGHSKEGRKKMYGQGWEIFKKHPLGVGVGNYHLANQKYFDFAQSMHCLYLEILTEVGLQGFIVVMALFLKLYTVLKRLRYDLTDLMLLESCRADHECREDAGFMYALVHALLVYFLVRLFVDILGMDLYGICWWFIIGISSSLYLIVSQMKTSMTRNDIGG